jgi:uncharacterized membrane protein YedE/YeeE
MNTAQWLGLATGVAFGFRLQKGRVLRFDKQIGALLLRDMTILKFMLSAILVGMVGVQLLASLGEITLGHKAMNVGAVVLGGALFGAGWAITGFCPGTAVGAVGEGRWHAIFAILDCPWDSGERRTSTCVPPCSCRLAPRLGHEGA